MATINDGAVRIGLLDLQSIQDYGFWKCISH